MSRERGAMGPPASERRERGEGPPRLIDEPPRVPRLASWGCRADHDRSPRARCVDACADRTRPLFGYAMMLGGFGAPLFLFLAGVALVLSAGRSYARPAISRHRGGPFRSADRQVFGLAFLFRLQSLHSERRYSAMSLLKVDILNVMGPSIAGAALTGRAAQRKVFAFAVCGRRRRYFSPGADCPGHAAP